MTLGELLLLLKDVKPAGDEFTALCPAHDDERPSLSVTEKDGKVLLCCHAGCTSEAVVGALGLTMADLFAKQPMAPKGELVATYDYVDEAGKLLYQVCRFLPKDFRQRRPNGNGGWDWGTKGIRRVLYRLPQVLEALKLNNAVFIAEGEKDVLELEGLGVAATCNSGGAGNWYAEFADYFAGGAAVVLPDNDEPGRKHADKVAGSLCGIAASVKVLNLPDLPAGGDVSDWIRGGGTKVELLTLVDAAAECDRLPRIDAGNQHLPTITAEAWRALEAANKPERFFLRHGLPCRLENSILEAGGDKVQVLQPKELNQDRLRHELARAAAWYTVRRGKDGQPVQIPAKPPKDVVNDCLATPSPPLPLLRRVTDVPVFTQEGRILDGPGFDLASGVYLQPASVVSQVPARPEGSNIEEARRWILSELLADFPFVGASDLAHAVGLLILPFVRELIAGPTPLHLIESPSPGSGKGLLASCLLHPGCGPNLGMFAQARDDDEYRKRITSILRDGRPAVLLDNIRGQLASGVLAAALTAPTWEDRLLGRTETTMAPVRLVWVCIGNNVSASTEIARRSVRIRLDPRVDRPWLREGFRHPALMDWCRQKRGDIVWAVLTLVQSWIAAGKPAPSAKPLGSFEDWSSVVGGILQNAGIPGFLENVLEFYDAADTEGAALRAFVEAWWDSHGSEEVRTADLWELGKDLEGLPISGKTEEALKVSFGKLLDKQRDRVIGDYCIQQARTSRRLAVWRLHKCEGLGVGGVEGVGYPVLHTRENEGTSIGIAEVAEAGIPTQPTQPTQVDGNPPDDPCTCGDTDWRFEPWAYNGEGGWVCCGCSHAREVLV